MHVYALLEAQAVLTLMPRMKGTGASSRSSILSWTGSTGSSRDCHAKGRMRGMSDRTDALSTPMLGQNTAICRSSSAAAHQHNQNSVLSPCQERGLKMIVFARRAFTKYCLC
jgi:hypothetical protein